MGVYLPTKLEPDAVQVVPGDTPLDIASLDNLIAELVAFGSQAGLPIEAEELHAFAQKYADDDLADSDMDLQTYAQLLLTAYLAKERGEPLWIVK